MKDRHVAKVPGMYGSDIALKGSRHASGSAKPKRRMAPDETHIQRPTIHASSSMTRNAVVQLRCTLSASHEHKPRICTAKHVQTK